MLFQICDYIAGYLQYKDTPIFPKSQTSISYLWHLVHIYKISCVKNMAKIIVDYKKATDEEMSVNLA
jgi:hypothetical protein